MKKKTVSSAPYFPKITLCPFSFIEYTRKKSKGQAVSFIQFGLTKFALLSRTHLIEEAGKLEKTGVLDRQKFNSDFLPILGEGSFTATQKKWGHHKRLLMRYLTPAKGNTVKWSAVVQRAANSAIRQCNHPHVNGVQFSRCIVQETLLEVFFGNPNAINKKKLHFLIRTMFATSELVCFLRLILTCHADLLIKPFQFIGHKAGNMLDNMINNAQATESSAWSDNKFRSELRTVLFAGHESLTYSLVNSLWILGNNESLQNQVRDEIKSVGLESLLLNHVILETFRIMPTVHTPPPRICQSDIVIDGVNIDSGTSILYGLWHAHHSCHNPSQYDIARFDKPKSYRMILPFGSGPKRCVGEHLAMTFLTRALYEVIINNKITSLNKTMPLKPRTVLMPRRKILFNFSAV